MHLLLNVHSSNPETNLDCECAVLQLTQALCERLLRQAEYIFRHRRDLPDLYEMYFWRSSVEFFGYDLIAACEDQENDWDDCFHEEGWALLPNGVDLTGFAPQRVECQQEIVRYLEVPSSTVRSTDQCFEFSWLAIPKHSDIYITTWDVTLPDLQCYVAAEKKPRQRATRRRKAMS